MGVFKIWNPQITISISKTKAKSMWENKLNLKKKLKLLEGKLNGDESKDEYKIFKENLKLFAIKEQMELKSEVDTISWNLATNLINFFEFRKNIELAILV